jgi:SAM-dependent methyltransferase
MTPTSDIAGCICCGACVWIPIPDPGSQSIASDWRIVAEPLARRACAVCGLAVRLPSVAAGASLFAEGYSLYAHAPGGTFERVRQEHYASWIAAAVSRAPQRILDVGCGNGSLLLALGDIWRGVELLGCDPSGASVAGAAGSGVTAWQGPSQTLDAGIADLVVAVNVIEHTPDPIAFLRDLRRACTEDGTVVVICPDGQRPGIELLFADHLFSFAPDHLHALAARAGLSVLRAEEAPQALGAFQMIVATSGDMSITGEWADGAALNARRAAYLRRWSALDAGLAARLPPSVVCFGAGEAAGLLRAYAPESWARVRACTADTLASGTFGPLPVVPLETLPAATAILVGVRPVDQVRVVERLASRFASVTTWYDLVEEPA